MKRITYRCRDDEKYKELQKKVIDDDLTFQSFMDKCVDLYLEGKLDGKLEGDD